ncbi:hypothetical protein M427DRAFT_266205 [Gonapodya prolifera JEL478]|uniref:Zinc/iron permease n=1 Tax=Gonapodya prolifera (strain JEL478) TaxID=1344416 RepID=A0A139AKF6_GONPJ|nr:hypothetical protein M427DRAFT_266205 [Gonapodya prolifera JEL478]|eukprot:KXS17271.1 hypothetical protein M427DRAFT_266205 [Gonapodya prolifera JEL478]
MLRRASRAVASVLLVLTALAISDVLVSPFVGGLSRNSPGFGLTLKNSPAWNRFGLVAGAAAETAAHDQKHSHGNPHSGHSHEESHDDHDHEHGKASSHESDETEATSEHPYYPIFRTLLPLLPTSSPLAASLAAAAVVSTAPLILVSFLPPNIPTTALNALVAFAGGTVLGDVFLHLLPHARVEFEAAAKLTSVSSLAEEAAHAHASAFGAGAANPHAHAHGHAHGTISHEHDHHPHSLASFKVEFATLAGILAFFLLERLLNVAVKARTDAVNRKDKSVPKKKSNGEKSDYGEC